MTSIWLFALSLVAAADPVPSSEEPGWLDRLRVGHWVEVRGELGSGGFVATRVEARKPRREARIWGTAEAGLRAGELKILGTRIEITPTTKWRGGSRITALGQRVRVRGHLSSLRVFLAERVEVREAGVERIEGRIDALRKTEDGGLALEILGFQVRVPPEARQRTEAPFERLPRILPRPLESSAADVADNDDLLGEGFQLGAQAHVALRQDVNYNSRRNFELDERDDTDIDDQDDRDDASHNLRARLTWAPSSRLSGLLDVRHRWRHRELRGDFSETDSRTRLGEAYVLARDLAGFDLQIGRQDFDEPREWLYDQNLDALRISRRIADVDVELSLSTTLDDGSSRDRAATNSILYVSNRYGPRHVAGYVVHRNFGDGRSETQTHVGARYVGTLSRHTRGWLELSRLEGDRQGASFSGWGGDLGVSWVAAAAHRLTLTAGYAYGSGNRDGRGFRQTGLQDNNTRVGGVTAVRYYGELFDPELANLRIATLGVGGRLTQRTSIEVLAHRYWQDVASTRILNSNLDSRPNGVDRDLGWETDLVVGLRLQRWDFELVLAHFSRGSAFGEGDDATSLNAQIRFRY